MNEDPSFFVRRTENIERRRTRGRRRFPCVAGVRMRLAKRQCTRAAAAMTLALNRCRRPPRLARRVCVRVRVCADCVRVCVCVRTEK